MARKKTKDMKKYHREWSKNNPEKCREKSRKFSRTPKGFYRYLAENCKKRNISLEVDRPDFIEWYMRQDKKCFYCEIPESLIEILPRIGYRKHTRLSIDRKDNAQGYKLSNIVLACSVCNTIKSNILSAEEMKLIGKIILREKWQKFQW